MIILIKIKSNINNKKSDKRNDKIDNNGKMTLIIMRRSSDEERK